MEQDLTLQPRQRTGLVAEAEVRRSASANRPDPAPSDFYLFESFKNFLAGKIFQDQKYCKKKQL
jgi:hypothetical protein